MSATTTIPIKECQHIVCDSPRDMDINSCVRVFHGVHVSDDHLAGDNIKLGWDINGHSVGNDLCHLCGNRGRLVYTNQ